jgi:probable phosphoglycerate mutase
MGREKGWHLNAAGKQQVAQMAERLKRIPIRAVYTSPLERAVETAEPVAASHDAPLSVLDELGEIHYGDWEGKTMEELDRTDEWRRYNTVRSLVRPPGGEMMIEVQARMVDQMDRLMSRHPGETLAVVSHGDPLRTTLAYYLHIAIDTMLRFEIGFASTSILEFNPWAARVLCINHQGDLPI